MARARDQGGGRRRYAYLHAMGIPVWVPRGETASASATPAGVEAAPAPQADEPAAAADGVAALDWPALERAVASCEACAELVANRSRTVFGVGDRAADWMIIGEAPGVEEDRQGEPFVGRAGWLLNAMLQAVGLARERVFIANILKCRPPKNRDPRPEEAAACEPFLERQITLVGPRVILAVGRVAAQNLLKTDAGLGRLRGRVHRYGPLGTPLVVTYHPAYLLRSPLDKRKAWEDLCLARRIVQGDGA